MKREKLRTQSNCAKDLYNICIASIRQGNQQDKDSFNQNTVSKGNPNQVVFLHEEVY